MSEESKSIVDQEDRKHLILEIGQIKDILDSFKYGLNFEEFADDYDEKVRVAREKRMELEKKLLNIKEKIGDN